MSRSTICLCMIVKNEEKDIKRCLESVIPFIDYWVISDTGSTDNTKKIIQELMDKHEVPGELHDHDWVDFSTNRNYALDLSRGHADFIWCMDADDDFCPSSSDPFRSLSKDVRLGHMMYLYEETGTTFNRACLISSDEKMKFSGVLHEVITHADGSTVSAKSRHLLADAGHIVARASPLKRNDTKRDKYLSDAKILEEDLSRNPDNYRSMFYLGQSYQLAGELDKAIEAYTLRSSFPDEGNPDEVYLSMYEIAKMKIHKEEPAGDCIDWCMRAWESCPTRIESLYLAMCMLYTKGRYGYALSMGMLASQCASPSMQSAKLEVDVYEFKFPDLYARCRFRCGDAKGAKDSLKKLIKSYEKSGQNPKAVDQLKETLATISSYDNKPKRKS